MTQELDCLPEGVLLEPGRITVTFEQAQEALEKRLALAMAIGNDFDRFERQVRSTVASLRMTTLGVGPRSKQTGAEAVTSVYGVSSRAPRPRL